MTALEQFLALAVLLLVAALVWGYATRRYLRTALKEARAERDAEVEENSRLRGEMVATTYGRAAEITDLTARLRGTNPTKENR